MEIRYELPAATRVSLAVYGEDGGMVRELLRGARQDKGKHTAEGDGLDTEGKALPPGNYQ